MISNSRLIRAILSGVGLLVLLALGAGCDSSESEAGRSLESKLEARAERRPQRAKVTLGHIHHFRDTDHSRDTGHSRDTDDRPEEKNTETDSPPRIRAQLEDRRVEIDGAYLVVSAIELHACVPGVDDYESPGPPLLNGIWNHLVGNAHAHVASSSTRLGTPYIENLLAEPDRAKIVGEIAPPLAAYCRMAAVTAPADEDVRNSTDLPSDEIVGSSLLVRGRWRRDDEETWNSFEFTTEAARVFEFDAIDPRTGDAPLMVESKTDEKMLLVDKQLGPATFAVDPTDPDAGPTVLERIGASMEVYEF